MKIKHLTLQTNHLTEQLYFYESILAFEVKNKTQDSFQVQVGWTCLEFQRSDLQIPAYHYCFLIPRNKLNEAFEWMSNRVEIIDTNEDEKLAFFEDWNAQSFYFLDPAGNIAECIVRHDLENDTTSPFSTQHFLCVNEIGLPTDNIRAVYDQFHNAFGLNIWKGDWERFSTIGSQEGLFLLPNHHTKTTWFPTEIKTKPVSIYSVIEINNQVFSFYFSDGRLINILSS